MDIHIIDDDDLLRELTQEIVEEAGFTVKGYVSAEEYIAYTKSAIYLPPKIAVITDVSMPGKSGFELIREVRKTNPKLRFVVISGEPHDMKNENIKACFYLQKPIYVDKLVAILTLLSSCEHAGNQQLASVCKLQSDLSNFDINNWHCPHAS